jgi:glycyl-tRNA synthetase beta chain
VAQESAELLLEIGCEEIPATFMRDALALLKKSLLEQLSEARLSYGEAQTYGTPRRMIVHVMDVQTHQSPEERTVRGPAKRACFDADGRPAKALIGFARSQGVEPDAVQFTGTPGSEYAVVQVHDSGKPAAEVLSEIIPIVIRGMTFPKMLYWGEAQMRFARPLRWLLALLDEQVIPFEIEGIPSGNRTRGHRFLSPNEWEVYSAKEFFTRLREACVVYDPEERKRIIRKGTQELAQSTGAKAVMEDALLEENVFLTEYPRLLLGSFPEEFLNLPASLLATTMQKHEKFFPIIDSSGKLLPHFISVYNAGKEDSVREGNEWVLVARFNDAKFFYEEDIKQSLDALVPRLERILFQQKLGTLLMKTSRLGALGWRRRWIGKRHEPPGCSGPPTSAKPTSPARW